MSDQSPVPAELISAFDAAARDIVELGNRLIDADASADLWEVSAGLLSGAVHFWLYAHQPCNEFGCEACVEIDTAEKRMKMLLAELRQAAETSEYYHSPQDSNVGRA